MSDQERAEHQQAHRAAVEGGMLPSYGDEERAEALGLARKIASGWMIGFTTEAALDQAFKRVAAALLATNEELEAKSHYHEEWVAKQQALDSAQAEVARLREENKAWKEDARGYVSDIDFWRKKAKAAEQKYEALERAAKDAGAGINVVLEWFEQHWSEPFPQWLASALVKYRESLASALSPDVPAHEEEK